MWKVKVKQGYDAMSFKFEKLEDACDFVGNVSDHAEGEMEFEMRKVGEKDVTTD